MAPSNLLIIFITGLTTGGLTCLALQGGLLTSVITQKEKDTKTSNQNHLPILAFLTSKIIVHTFLGALLGLLGSAITVSVITRGWLEIFIGIYLFGIAGNLLNLHPFFRYFVIKPPKFFAKLARNESKSKSIFAPALLGFMTIFLPCATTQAMEVVAIGTGSPLYGAAVMLAFVLGTSPTFLLFGFLLNKGSVSFQKYFPSVAGSALLLMSLYTVNSGISLTGSPYTIQNFVSVATQTDQTKSLTSSTLGDNVQTLTINVDDYGYTPKNVTLKKDVPTILKLVTKNVQSCSRSFTIPSLNIQKLLPVTGETTLEFTPTTLGPLAFSCSMGMYTGKFNVVN